MLLDSCMSDSLNSLRLDSEPNSPSTSSPDYQLYSNPTPCTSCSLSLAWKQGGRSYMEDRHLIHIKRHKNGELDYMLLGVFDGHGGSAAVDAAVRIFPQQSADDPYVDKGLCTAIKKCPVFQPKIELAYDFVRNLADGGIKFEYGLFQENERSSCALRMAFWRTNRQMYNEFGSWPSNITGCPSLAGSTATVILIKDGELLVANVGDTAAVIGLQSDDSPSWYPVGRRATVEHTVSGEEAKRIQTVGGAVKETETGNARVSRVVWSTCEQFCWAKRLSCEHPKAQKPLLNMTRSLGDFWSFSSRSKRNVISCDPHIAKFSIQNDKIFGICLHSDGIMMRPRKIAEMMSNEAVTEEQENIQPTTEDHKQECIAETILNEYYRARKAPPPAIVYDNATVITLKFNSDCGVDVESLKESPDSGSIIKIPHRSVYHT